MKKVIYERTLESGKWIMATRERNGCAVFIVTVDTHGYQRHELVRWFQGSLLGRDDAIEFAVKLERPVAVP